MATPVVFNFLFVASDNLHAINTLLVTLDDLRNGHWYTKKAYKISKIRVKNEW